MYLVRMRSNGARIRPVVTAAPTTTPRDAHGYWASIISDVAPRIPGSGVFSNAEIRPRDQFSSVSNKKA
jgi:hypothetical protein